jgi:hypothetical protein
VWFHMGSRVRGSFSSFAFSDAILLACGIQFEWNIALPVMKVRGFIDSHLVKVR